MRFSLKLIESDSEIRKLILDQLLILVKNTINKAIPNIKLETKKLIRTSILSEPEYSSLTSTRGKLRLEFGIQDVSMVDMAIDNILDTIDIKLNNIKVATVGIVGGFILTAIPEDDLLLISKSFSQKTEKGVSLEWLRWLLYEGASPIVRGYTVSFRNSSYSRTGGALMVESRKSWRVPPEFIGTVTNNWITRAIDKTNESILNIIQQEIEKQI